MGASEERQGKESSFCEQKEAKKLHSLGAEMGWQRSGHEKSFCFFFFRKRRILASLDFQQ
jgi:hypothetical protein